MSDWKKLQKAAERQGWKVVPTNSGHLKWLSPNGVYVTFSGVTNSDRRALKNHIAHLRKGGFRP